MKYKERKKNYIVEKDEHLILHPLLSNKKIKNPFKHYVTEKKYYLILNDLLPSRKKFGKKPVKYPQSKVQYELLLKGKFPVVKDIDFDLKKYLTDKEYRQRYKRCQDYVPADKFITTKKITKKIGTARDFAKIVLANAAIVVGIYLVVNYGPGLYDSAKNFIVSRFRPDSKVAIEFDPSTDIKDDKINTDINNTNDEDKKITEIVLDEDSLMSYDLLKTSNLGATLQLYLDDTRTVSPMFVYQTEKEDGLKTLCIYCKLGETEMVKFEYDIIDPNAEYYYNDLFYSVSISPSDVINSLSVLASDEYLTDIPLTSKLINLDETICASVENLKDEVKYDIIDGEFVEKEIYTFKIVALEDNGQIVEKHYEINKEDAEKLEGFDAEDLNSLIEIYKKDQTQFTNTATFDLGYNAPTLVLVNAERQSKSQTPTLPSDGKDQDYGDLTL